MGSHSEALDLLLEAYVEGQVETAVRPVREALETAARERAQALTLLGAADGTIADLREEIVVLKADLAACRASHQPAPRKMVIGTATSPQNGTTAQRVDFVRGLQADMAAAGGELGFVHTFSSQTIAAFGTAGDNAVLKAFPGLGVMINAKTPGADWAGVPSGKYRAEFAALLDTTLAWVKQHGGRVYITVDHEPENDGKSAAEWRKAQAWYVQQFYAHEIAQHGDYCFVLMAYTFEPASGRTPADWDGYRELPAALASRPLMGLDVYFRADWSVQQNWDSRAKRGFDWCAQNGHRVVVWEWAVNNDVRKPDVEHAALIAALLELMRAAGVEAAAYYPHPGPAAGQNPYPGPVARKALAAASR